MNILCLSDQIMIMGGKRDLTLILQGKTKVNLAFFQVILFEKVLYVHNIYF
jgi:hypothetical protein